MLKIENITKVFALDSINERKALDNLSLSLTNGEFITVIGGNGAGKSTLLNCIAGVYEIDKGYIYLDGQDITYTPEHKRSRMIGRVFQDPLKGTAFDMTIEENLAIAYAKAKTRSLRPGIKKADTKLFKDKLALLGLGLENRIHQKVGLLSGGQRQALTLLMATLVKPKLLLLDEHTAALDPGAALKVLALTKMIVEENKLNTIMVTHNMQNALDYGTRTIMMHEGKIILDLSGSQRGKMTVDKLVKQFTAQSGQMLEHDRLLLS